MTQILAMLTHNYMPILSLVLAYLLGSIPTSYLIGKIFYGVDIRESGSGNTGATNALRTFGAKVGVIVLIIDMLKGIAAILIVRYVMNNTYTTLSFNLMESLAGFFVIAGHVFSVFLKFKGGKGVATTAGVFLILSPITFIYCLVLFAFVVYTTKYVSLGSILAASAFLITEVFSQYLVRFTNVPRLWLVTIIVFLILIRHKANVKRLLEGSENKFKLRKDK
jgi:glycerol-3-phosphate acyltransferase PlsY